MTKKSIGRYFLNIAIALDVFGSVLSGGNPNETISYRIGRMKLKYGGYIPWRRPLVKFIDWGLDRIDENHSIEAYDNDLLGQRIMGFMRQTLDGPGIINQYLQGRQWAPGARAREKTMITMHLDAFYHYMMLRIREGISAKK